MDIMENERENEKNNLDTNRRVLDMSLDTNRTLLNDTVLNIEKIKTQNIVTPRIFKEETLDENDTESVLSNIKEKQKINNKYLLKKLISKGSFGKVYRVNNLETNEDLVAKIEKCKPYNKVETLAHEAKILHILKDCKNVSKVIWYGTDEKNNFLVMNNLGKSLNIYIKKYKKFSLKNIGLIVLKLIDIFESIHNKGIIHRDIKPENILLQNNDINLIDFGLSKSYLKSKKHYPYNDKKSFVGTTRYASLNVHKNIAYSRRDDLESLFYVMIYLYFGKLPWQGLNIEDKDTQKTVICKIKEKIKLLDIWQDVPNEYQLFYNNIINLKFEEKPNYTFLKSLIEINFKENKITYDINSIFKKN